MELSCKTCLSKLFFRLPRGPIVHELPSEAIAQVFVWKCRAQLTFSKLFVKASAWNCGAKVAFPQATCQAFAWNCRAKVAL